jgi:hypothetical protein
MTTNPTFKQTTQYLIPRIYTVLSRIKNSLLALAILLASSFACLAQDIPWKNAIKMEIGNFHVTADSTIEDTTYLTPDTIGLYTLHQPMMGVPLSTFDNYYYRDSTKKLGYGYLNKSGKPYGVWRYYTLKNNQFELYCEGHYLKPDTQNIETPAKNLMPQVPDIKSHYLKELGRGLMLSGEWRFYDQGKIIARFHLGEKYELEFFPLFSETGEIQYELKTPQRKTAGILIEEEYYTNGRLKNLYCYKQDYRMAFDEDGIPLLPPIHHGPFLKWSDGDLHH